MIWPLNLNLQPEIANWKSPLLTRFRNKMGEIQPCVAQQILSKLQFWLRHKNFIWHMGSWAQVKSWPQTTERQKRSLKVCLVKNDIEQEAGCNRFFLSTLNYSALLTDGQNKQNSHTLSTPVLVSCQDNASSFQFLASSEGTPTTGLWVSEVFTGCFAIRAWENQSI